MRRRCAVLIPLVLAVCAVGCGPVLILGAASAAGTGAVVWYRGWVEQTIEVPHDRVFRASRSALGNFDIALEDETCEQDRGVLDGYASDGKHVMVKTNAAGEKATRVRIRVGFWGDQGRALRILEQIKKHL